jgi:hypothetical protein
VIQLEVFSAGSKQKELRSKLEPNGHDFISVRKKSESRTQRKKGVKAWTLLCYLLLAKVYIVIHQIFVSQIVKIMA